MLRQIHDGFELRGFTRVPIEWSWDDNSCFQRITRTSGRSGFTPPVPPNQVRVSQSDAQRASKYVTSGRTLFEMQSNDTSGLVCAKVNYRRGELKKTALEGIWAARREVSYGAYFAETGSGELRGPSVKKYDERGKKIHGMAYGCLAFVQLVNDTPSTLELVTANDVIAYHPDDVTRWYKTKAACEDAFKNKPRVRLSPDQRGVAALTPPRLFRGC